MHIRSLRKTILMKNFCSSLFIILSAFLLITCSTETTPIYTLTTSANGEGFVFPSSGEFEAGSTVEITATANEGWFFSEWSGDVSSKHKLLTLVINSDKKVTATFKPTLATLNTKEVSNITSNSAISGGNITSYGGLPVIERGTCYATVESPTLADSCTIDDNDNDSFTSMLENLNSVTTYYIRAYASNIGGTAYGDQIVFTTKFEIAEVTNSETGKTWLDRNLGASRIAVSPTDSKAYGDLYQWGRFADGHQVRNSATSSTLSSTDSPGHGSFILGPNIPYDWRSPQNDSLWQGIDGINNPCPEGYRLPTETEWEEERESWISYDNAGAWASPLKLPVGGRRYFNSGSLYDDGSVGHYWSSTVYGVYARILTFSNSNSSFGNSTRAYGFSVRCIKD